MVRRSPRRPQHLRLRPRAGARRRRHRGAERGHGPVHVQRAGRGHPRRVRPRAHTRRGLRPRRGGPAGRARAGHGARLPAALRPAGLSARRTADAELGRPQPGHAEHRVRRRRAARRPRRPARGRTSCRRATRPTSSQWKLQIDGDAGRPSCVLVDDKRPGIRIVTSTVTAADGRWHAVQCRRAGTTLAVLVDGIVRGSTTVPAKLSVSNERPLSIGGKGALRRQRPVQRRPRQRLGPDRLIRSGPVPGPFRSGRGEAGGHGGQQVGVRWCRRRAPRRTRRRATLLRAYAILVLIVSGVS